MLAEEPPCTVQAIAQGFNARTAASARAAMGLAVKIANQPTFGRSLVFQVEDRCFSTRRHLLRIISFSFAAIPGHSLGPSIDQEDFHIVLLHGQGSTCFI